MRLALGALLLLLPASAFAQQPHWTNASELGMRVTPAIIAEQPWRVRVGGGGGSVFRGDDGNVDTNDEDIQALAGQLALAWAPAPKHPTLRGLDIVYSGAATYMTAADPHTPNEPPTWKANLGDAFLGARYVYETRSPISFGGELGAIIYGLISEKADTSLQIAAEHPFGFVARGLATARLGDAAFSANAAFISDGSYDVWKTTAKDGCLYEQRSGPGDDWALVQCTGGVPQFTEAETRLAVPEEDLRTAYGIYGEKGNISRIAFGLSASKPLPRQETLVPFFEITGEMNGSELVTRATPGITFQRENLFIIASADVRLSPAPFSETALLSAPGEPDARVNIGLQLALGEETRRTFVNGTPTPRPTPNVLTVRVVNAVDKPIEGARIALVDAQGSERALTTESDGTVTIPRSAIQPGSRFKAGQPGDYRVWPRLWSIPPPQQNTVTVKAWETSSFAPVRIDFKNERGQPYTAKPVTLSLYSNAVGPQATQFRTNQAGVFLEDLPSAEWKIVASCDCALAELVVLEQPIPQREPVNVTVYLVGDPSKGLLAFDLRAPATAVSTPPPPSIDPLKGVFEPDLAEVRLTAELRSVLGLLRTRDGLRATLTVNVKGAGGDPLFLETLAKARQEALSSYLAKEGFGPTRVRVKYDFKAPDDSVSVLLDQ